MPLDAYDLRPLPRLHLLDQVRGGSLRLSRFSFTLLDLFLVFLMGTLSLLAGLSLLQSSVTQSLQTHRNPVIQSVPSGPVFARSVVNTPARAFDLTAHELRNEVNN